MFKTVSCHRFIADIKVSNMTTSSLNRSVVGDQSVNTNAYLGLELKRFIKVTSFHYKKNAHALGNTELFWL